MIIINVESVKCSAKFEVEEYGGEGSEGYSLRMREKSHRNGWTRSSSRSVTLFGLIIWKRKEDEGKKRAMGGEDPPGEGATFRFQ